MRETSGKTGYVFYDEVTVTFLAFIKGYGSVRIEDSPSRIVWEIIGSQEALPRGPVLSRKRERRLSFLLGASKRPGRAC